MAKKAGVSIAGSAGDAYPDITANGDAYTNRDWQSPSTENLR